MACWSFVGCTVDVVVDAGAQTVDLRCFDDFGTLLMLMYRF